MYNFSDKFIVDTDPQLYLPQTPANVSSVVASMSPEHLGFG